MLESAKKEFQKLERTIMTNNVPRLENTASLALFIKKELKIKSFTLMFRKKKFNILSLKIMIKCIKTLHLNFSMFYLEQ